MSFPNDIQKRDLIKNYLQEALKYGAEIDLAQSRLAEVFDSIKESEEHTEFSLKEFKEAYTAARAYEKTQAVVDKKTAALEVVDLLNL